MKKYFLCTLVIASLLLTPLIVKAGSSNQITSSFSNNELASRKPEILAQTTKYYKNVTVYDTSDYQTYSLNSNSQPIKAISSETIEVSEEEYLSIDPDTFQSVSINASTTVETTYLLLITSIGYDGQYYYYADSFNYKIVPSVRSYDIIGIGHYNDVKPVDGTMSCVLVYGTGGKTRHFDLTGFKTSSTGSSCVIDLPDEKDAININISFQFQVQKVNPNETVNSQIAVGDYRHAKEGVSILVAASHDVNASSGIVFPSRHEAKYQIITPARVRWDEPW